jgi:hypothetical protein
MSFTAPRLHQSIINVMVEWRANSWATLGWTPELAKSLKN